MTIIFSSVFARALSITLLLSLLLGSSNPIWLPLVGTSDTLTLNGTSGAVTIMRDDAGVPHIRAASEADAQFGLGYVHAQDRLWQMEWQRRLASGRTAEFLGDKGLPFDVLFRTVGIRRAAEASWSAMPPTDRAPIEAYVAGINAFLTSRTSKQLPPEYGILGITAEPWSPVDVLAFGKLFVWGNGSNWDKELLRGQLAARLGSERAAQLTPAYTADGPVIVPDMETRRYGDTESTSAFSAGAQFSILNSQFSDLLALHEAVATQTGIGADGRGSNAWVLSGRRTTSGKPLLANDPHLAAQSPAIWYLAQLAWGDHMVIGATVPGGPGVQIGHNDAIAWGLTTINVDTQDIYAEQINERNEALYQGAWEPLQIVPETITIKGQADVTLNVRVSRHGPLLSDALSASSQKDKETRGQGDKEIESESHVSISPLLPVSASAVQTALAVRWTGHNPQDEAFLVALAVNRARDWREFTQAFRDYRAANQNYVYADHAGNIGYFMAGTVPIRAKGDGSVPVPGWTGDYEWTGYVPWERLPQRYNPPEGYIVTANNKVAGDEYPYLISNSYAVPYRAARIIEMLESQGKTKFSADRMAAMQADVLAVQARTLMPTLLRTQPTDERSRQSLALLQTWDFRATGDSAATAVFEAWYIRIAQRLFADELGDLWKDYSKNLYFVGMATETALRENQPWCDDTRTDAAETCADTLAAALGDALDDMAAAQGSDDIAAWRWDRVHRAQFTHQPLGGNPDLGPVFNRSIPNGGDRFTVNVASSFRAWEDYDQLHAAQYRQIIDFGDLENSRWIIAPGQSGLPSSPHYADLLERWQQVTYMRMR